MPSRRPTRWSTPSTSWNRRETAGGGGGPAPRGGARRPPLPGRDPRPPGRRGGSVHAVRRGSGAPEKLVSRHPHVFGDAGPTTARGRCRELGAAQGPGETPRGVFEGIPGDLPLAALATELLRKVRAPRPRRIGRSARARPSRRPGRSPRLEEGAPAGEERFGEVLFELCRVARSGGSIPSWPCAAGGRVVSWRGEQGCAGGSTDRGPGRQ